MAGTIGNLLRNLPKVESMHPLSERDRAKKDYGRLPARAEVRSTSIRGKLSFFINAYKFLLLFSRLPVNTRPTQSPVHRQYRPTHF